LRRAFRIRGQARSRTSMCFAAPAHPCALPAPTSACGFGNRERRSDRHADLVGWVVGSQNHQVCGELQNKVGFAALNPPYDNFRPNRGTAPCIPHSRASPLPRAHALSVNGSGDRKFRRHILGRVAVRDGKTVQHRMHYQKDGVVRRTRPEFSEMTIRGQARSHKRLRFR
jgi:hypothetical protein